MSTPNTGIPYVPESTLDPAAGLNLALNVIDALLQTRVLSMALTAPPGSPADGDLYIPASPATGDWLGLEDYLVRYVAEGDFWQSYTPGAQVHLVLNIGDGGFYKYLPGSPGGWVLAAGLGDAPSDDDIYGRQNGAWVSALMDLISDDTSPEEIAEKIHTLFLSGIQLVPISPGVARLIATSQPSLTVLDSDSPPTVSVPNVSELIIGNNMTLSQVAPGIAQIAATGGGGGGDAPLTPDSHPTSPNAMDDEFEATSLDAKWTWFNQGTATATFGRGAVHIQTPVEAALNIRGFEQAHSGPARYRVKFTGVNVNNFNMGGIYFRNTSNSRLVTFALHRVGGVYAVYNWTDANTFSSAPLGDVSRAAYAQPVNQGWLYGEMEDDGTNLIFRLSHTGQDGMFDQVLSVTRASFLGTPDRVGLYAFAQNASTPGRAYCDWFRRMA